jgi:3-dehydroquinate synthase
MMDTLLVSLGERSYPIVTGECLINDTGVWNEHVRSRDVFVVTNVTVAPLWLPRLRDGLAGRHVEVIELPDGERFKTLATLGTVFDAMVSARMNRDCVVVALGGGVVGDIAGFAAACYQRGVAYVQVPTSLLAQVDSSVGGKTAVDHPGGKNLIGAFHQPTAVITDINTLSTLPDRELRAGISEVIKYGLIFDLEFFAWIENNVVKLLSRDAQALNYAIRRSCEHKARVVATDEREQGARALLNLGHTFGHAIETATAYGEWLHGEAVAVGMLLAADLSHRVGWLSRGDVDRVRALLPPLVGAARVRELMSMDKKVKSGQLRLILLERLGSAVISADYPPQLLDAVLRDGFGAAR